MIIINHKKVSAIYKGTQKIIKRYKGSQLVFEALKKLTIRGVSPLKLENSVGKDLVNYKIYGNTEEVSTNDYVFLDYLQSTDKQYIDTGFIPNQDTKVYCKFQLSSIGANYPFGVRYTSQTDVCYVSGGSSTWNFRFGAKSTISHGTTDTALHEIEMSKSGIYFDNKKIATPSSAAFVCMGNLYLFATNNNGAVAYGDTKIFEFKMWHKNNLIRYYKPCYRVSDNVLGMLDLVKNVFYQNKTTTPFTQGEEVEETEIITLNVGDFDDNERKYKLPVTIGGKNLIEYPYQETNKEINGITYTDNKDGTVTVNGTATGNAIFNLTSNSTHMWYGLEHGETYTVSLYASDPAITSGVSLTVNYYPVGSGSYQGWTSAGINNKKTAVCPDDMSGLRSYIYVFSGTTVNNVTLRPQLERGSVATEPELYVKPTTYNIYLDEPLREENGFYDYLDYKNQKVVAYTNSNPTEQSVELPTIATNTGTNMVYVDTNTKPSEIEVVYV